MTKNKPIKTYRVGNISLSLWENEGNDNVKFKSFSFERTYKDGEEQWKNTKTLKTNDLLKLKELLNLALMDQIVIE